MSLNLIISLIIFALLIAILALIIFILRDKDFSNALKIEFLNNKSKLKRLANTIKIFVSSLILILFALVIIVAIFGVGL